MIARTALALAPLLALASPLQDGTFRVEPDQQNVVASRLEGAWVPDAVVGERLGTEAHFARIEFESDPSIVARIPEKYSEFLAEKQLFQAGMMTMRRRDKLQKHAFLLIVHSGNPHVVFFRERDGDPFGDGESFNVALTPGKEKKNDLLFVGGDHNNQPFDAYRRAEG